jgi:hypothetical protein
MRTIVKKLASVGGHRFGGPTTALRADDGALQLRHHGLAICPLGARMSMSLASVCFRPKPGRLWMAADNYVLQVTRWAP